MGENDNSGSLDLSTNPSTRLQFYFWVNRHVDFNECNGHNGGNKSLKKSFSYGLSMTLRKFFRHAK